MKVSDWVNTCHNLNKITGFVTDISADQVTICVTIPKNYGHIMVKREEAWLADDSIWMDDIPTMIDLSLMIRDKEWFQKWIKELSMWKSVEEVDLLF